MYTTISLRSYKAQAAANSRRSNSDENNILFPPPEGPNSAYLVFQEDEDEKKGQNDEACCCCWGCCEDNRVRELPFPQDKCLTVEYSTLSGQSSDIEMDRIYAIPVLGQPLSSHSYYVKSHRELIIVSINARCSLLETCSKEDDMITVCCCRCIKDVRCRSLEVDSPYQQIQIIQNKSSFTSKCIVSDGLPPEFLRNKDWIITAKRLRGKHGRLAHACGINTELRPQLPSLDFPISEKTSGIVTVGEWYCPFIFINELGGLEDPKRQLMETPFYKMDLHKFWEEIYRSEVSEPDEDIVVEKRVRVEKVLLSGKGARVEKIIENDGSVWIKGLNGREELKGIKLSRPMIEKMRADQGRTGESPHEIFSVNRSFSSLGKGRKFACYVIVERYVLRRMDGTVVLTYSFRNCNHIEAKWDL
eukprot:Gb_22147 [translate_table: standard]